MDLEPILNLRALNRPPKTVYRELLVLSSTQNLAKFFVFPFLFTREGKRCGLRLGYGIWDGCKGWKGKAAKKIFSVKSFYT